MTTSFAPFESPAQPEDYAATLQLAQDWREHHNGANPLLTQEHDTALTPDVKIPFTMTSVVPIGAGPVEILIPGLGSSEKFYRPLAEELAYGGITAVTVKPERTQGKDTWSRENLLHPEALLPKEIEAVVRHLYDIYGLENFGLTGHSWGGRTGVEVAEKLNRQECGPKIARIKLLEAAGVTIHDTITLTKRLPWVAVESAKATLIHPEVVPEAMVHFYKNVPRTAGEIYRAANCRLTGERLHDLRNIGVIATADFHERDAFFPAHEAEAQIGGAIPFFNVGTAGGHLAPLTHPKAVANDLLMIDSITRLQAA